MIALFFVACLKIMPLACEEHTLFNMDDAGRTACMVQAQRRLAAWTETHPDFTIMRWACRPESSRKLPA